MSFADELTKVFKKKKTPVDQEDIEQDELKESGIEVQKGDPRLTGGIRLSNLTPSERAKLQKRRSAP